MVRDTWLGLLDLIAPHRCAACATLLGEGGSGFCGACEPLIERLPVESSPSCEERAACRYGGPLRDALHALKYGRDTTRAPALTRLLFPHAEALRGRIDVVTCVPLHTRRLRARGFNQSALLAAPVARYLAARCAPRLLARVRDVPHQVGTGRAARLDLSRSSMHVRGSLTAGSVLVIDDVRTTGATLHAARDALLAAGAERVFTLVVASAD